MSHGASDRLRHRHINRAFARLEKRDADLATQIELARGTVHHAMHTITHILERLMTTQQEYKAEVEQLKQDIIEDEKQDDANATRLEKIVADQQAIIDAGGTVDWDALKADLQGLRSQLHGPSTPGGETEIPVGQ